MADGQFDRHLFSYQAPEFGISGEELKTCWMCREAKPLSSFGKDAGRASGLNPKCKACCAATYVTRRNANPRKEKRCEACGITKPVDAFDLADKAKRPTLLKRFCRDCSDLTGGKIRKPFPRSPNAVANNKAYRKRLAQRDEVEIPDEQICSLCDELKAADQFSRSKTEASGIKSICKICAEAARLASLRKPRRLPPDMRLCTGCQTDLPPSQFHKKSDAPDGLSPLCISCERERMRSWYTVPENATKARDGAKRWTEANPDLARAIAKVNKQRRREAEGSFTSQEWIDLVRYYGHRCAYCLRHESEFGNLTIDHLQPIVRGGTNYIWNAVPACLRCNISKHKSTLLELLHRGWVPPDWP